MGMMKLFHDRHLILHFFLYAKSEPLRNYYGFLLTLECDLSFNQYAVEIQVERSRNSD